MLKELQVWTLYIEGQIFSRLSIMQKPLKDSMLLLLTNNATVETQLVSETSTHCMTL